MEPLAHDAIRMRQRGYRREHGTFPVRLVGAPAATRLRLQLLEALPHRGFFLVREPAGFLSGRGGAPWGFLSAVLCRFHSVFLPMRVPTLSCFSSYLYRD